MIQPDSLTLRERAAQLLFPRLGSNMPPPVTAAEDTDRCARLLDECPVGGLLLFNGHMPELRSALGRLQQMSRVPLLVAADMERGVGQQIRGATVFPHAMAFSAMDDGAARLEAAARVQAKEALACGIHVTCSPVADVNRDPRNPIIATRAFSSDPDAASRLVRAFIRGCRAEGLLTAAKHFPGHGNTSRDSHAEVPVVEATRDELESFDLLPFRAAIEEGVDLVMSAHVLYPALDAARPATLSRRILDDLLRDEMGFAGAVVTDSLLMGAVKAPPEDLGEQAADLVEAGVDVLLDIPDPVAAVEGIVRAVESGRLEEARLDAAVGRVHGLKRRMVDRFGADVFVSPPAAAVGSSEAAAISAGVARAAVTVVDDAEGHLPIRDGRDVVALLLKPHRTRFDPEEEPFGRLIRGALPGVWFRQVGPEADAAAYDELHARLEGARLVVAALVVKPAAWHAFGLLPEQQQLLRKTVATRPTVVASLGTPYVLEGYTDAGARICAFSDVEASQRALVERLVAS